MSDTKKTKTRYIVYGSGNQAPYGDGEIISIHRTLNAACKAAKKWYNPAIVADDDDTRYNVYTQDIEY